MSKEEKSSILNEKRDSIINLPLDTDSRRDSEIHIQSMDSSVALLDEKKPTQNSPTPPEQREKVNFIENALKGNFMPAMLKLESGELKINDPINEETGETLLHLSAYYSFYNVTRTLVEKFNANVNIQNKDGSTPLHIICNNQIKDLVLLMYLLSQPGIQIDVEDNVGLTPVNYATMNNFNIAFMCLVERGADLSHIDKYGNNIIYFALVHNNIFVTNFLYKHCNEIGISINSTFYNNTVTLSDIFITNKNIECCEHLFTNYNHKIELESIVHCCKFITEFPFYNRYNYEIINTLLYYRARDFRGFINSLFPVICCCLRRKKRPMRLPLELSGEVSFRKILGPVLDTSAQEKYNIINGIPTNIDMIYEYRSLNIFLFFYRFFLPRYERILVACVYLYTLFLTIFGSYVLYNRKKYLVLAFYNILAAAFSIMFNSLRSRPTTEELKFTFTDKEHNILGHFKKALDENDVFSVPFESEICEICLKKKSPTTVHCYKCDKCVDNYSFHSILFGCCDIDTHFLLTFVTISFMYFHLLFGLNVVYHYNHSLFSLLVFYFFFFIMIGKAITQQILYKYRIGYHAAYNYHKENNTLTNFELRNNNYFAIPKINRKLI